jgi:protein TonB
MGCVNREDVTMGERAIRGFFFAASAAIHLGMLTIVTLAWTPSPLKTSAGLIPVELLALETGKEKTTFRRTAPAVVSNLAKRQGKLSPVLVRPEPLPAPVLPETGGGATEVAARADELLTPSEQGMTGQKSEAAFASVTPPPSGEATPSRSPEIVSGLQLGGPEEGASSLLKTESGDASVQPQYGTTQKPEYPVLARQRGYEGLVLLKVRVLHDGTVGDIRVERSSGYELLDQAALEAVRRWTFVPAKRKGVAVAIWVTIPIRFSLAPPSWLGQRP